MVSNARLQVCRVQGDEMIAQYYLREGLLQEECMLCGK